MGKKLFFTLGTKIEHNDYTGFEAEPSARLKWDLSSRQMLWTAVSRAVRTPSRIDRDFKEAAPPALVLLEGDSAFTSETVVAYELGYRAQLGTRVTTSLSMFYNDYDDVRSTSFTPATLLPFFFANNLAGETHGLEYTGSFQAFGWWQLRGTYDLLKEKIGVKPGQFDLNGGLNETSDPEQQFSVTSTMDLPDDLGLNAALRWVGALPNNSGPTPGTVPSYFELNIHLVWRPAKRLELSLLGQNLLHDRHPEYGFPSPTREEILRSIYGKAAWRY